MAKKRDLGIRAIVNLDQLGVGQSLVGGRVGGSLPARHKGNSDERPYCVANEFICAELGRVIRLPIPAFAITYTEQVHAKYLFSTLDMNYSGQNFLPVDPPSCVRHLPELCAGIVAFDIFIVNQDRHDANLVVDNTAQPKKMFVYDHDVAMFGSIRTQGEARLARMRDRLGITGGGHSGGVRHCLLDAITTTRHFSLWLDRIAGIPYRLLKDICGEAVGYGITRDEATAAKHFLEQRQRSVKGLIDRHRPEFRGITAWETL